MRPLMMMPLLSPPLMMMMPLLSPQAAPSYSDSPLALDRLASQLTDQRLLGHRNQLNALATNCPMSARLTSHFATCAFGLEPHVHGCYHESSAAGTNCTEGGDTPNKCTLAAYEVLDYYMSCIGIVRILL